MTKLNMIFLPYLMVGWWWMINNNKKITDGQKHHYREWDSRAGGERGCCAFLWMVLKFCSLQVLSSNLKIPLLKRNALFLSRWEYRCEMILSLVCLGLWVLGAAWILMLKYLVKCFLVVESFASNHFSRSGCGCQHQRDRVITQPLCLTNF